MWVSSTSTDGDIGGVNGATTICETDASSSAPIAGLTHRAVIATSSNDPRNYFSNNPPVQRPDGTVITDTYSDFFDPAKTITNRITTSSPNIWTGLDGNSGAPHNTHNCQSWSSNLISTRGRHGIANLTSRSRYDDGDYGCSSAFPLLCISY